jgi:hypothetical protein
MDMHVWYLRKREGLECDCLSDNAVEIGCMQGEGVSLSKEGRKDGRMEGRKEGRSHTIGCVQGCTVVCMHELVHNTYCCLIRL